MTGVSGGKSYPMMDLFGTWTVTIPAGTHSIAIRSKQTSGTDAGQIVLKGHSLKIEGPFETQ